MPEPSDNDWRRQMRERITTLDELAERLPGVAVTDGMRHAAERYAFAVTPYYLSLVEAPSPSDPIFRQCVPDAAALGNPSGFADDELAEQTRFSPVPGLIRRYADRVVLLATTACPTYCRHCTRKRLVGREPAAAVLEAQVAYVRAHPEIRDVILSGGDPLTVDTDRLDAVLAAVRSVPTVDIIRVGTRAPVTLPMRIDEALCDRLARHHPVWVNTHFNHPREITAESAAACDRLLRRGIPVNNQAVLLRGVNDSPDVMEALCRALLRIRVRPYYLFQCDPVAGVEHFRTPVSRGREIMRHVQASVGGLGVPRYAVDAIAGGGKVPIGPEYVVEHTNGCLVLRNPEGEHVIYPDGPANRPAGNGAETPNAGLSASNAGQQAPHAEEPIHRP
jgi:lysine 2,3-aminomutase